MNKKKDIWVYGFAIFASFFGAGNLILPPFLGYNSGPDWWLVLIGFSISAVTLPILGLFAHARLQGTMLDLGNKVSPIFSLLFCISVYLIALSLPIPRTASVTHEMAILPYFGTSSLLTSGVYFLLVLLFAWKRSKVIEILGKLLTPGIIVLLLLIIGIGTFIDSPGIQPSTMDTPIIGGLLEGYQTYDALGGIVMGGIVVISLNLDGYTSYEAKRNLIAKSGLLAGFGLLSMYAGLIALGAWNNAAFDVEITRPQLLSGLSEISLGNTGRLALAVLVSLACFTTAVSVIVGTADFFKGLFKESEMAYNVTVIVACILGVLVGQWDVHYIIVVAVPVLMFIYPLTIVLVLLNVIPTKYASRRVFIATVAVTFLFSIPDFIGVIGEFDFIPIVKKWIPLGEQNLGWVIPGVLAFIISNFFSTDKRS